LAKVCSGTELPIDKDESRLGLFYGREDGVFRAYDHTLIPVRIEGLFNQLRKRLGPHNDQNAVSHARRGWWGRQHTRRW
jgi:hypothetical protein